MDRFRLKVPNVDLSLFFAGLVLAIPLSIFANILTPRFQAWSAKRSQRAAEKLFAVDVKFKARIDQFRRNPEEYTAFFRTNLLYVMWGISRMVMIAGGGILAATLLAGTLDGDMLGMLAVGLLAVDGVFLHHRGLDAYRVASALGAVVKDSAEKASEAGSST